MQVQMPAARRLAQLPDQYADGGLVARMKSADAGPAAFGARGLSQLRDLVPKMAAMGYPQQAAAAAPAPAPVSNPRAAQLMAMIPQMEAMGYQQKPLTPQMLASGGVVRGPGTGTSDSIATEAEPGTYIMPADSTAAIGPSALEKMGTVPVRLSDGEFKLPPEQVMAIGEAVLKLMKDATHTPVNGVDGGQTDAEVEDDDDEKGARGFNPADRMAQMPEQMFADGGLIENDVTRVGNSYSGGNVSGGITVNGAAPAGTFSENPAGRVAAPPAPRPAPTTISVTRATPAVGAQDPAAGFASPVDRMATAPAPAPMGWQARQDQRSADVSSSSITNRPEWRRYADGGVVEDDLQKRLMQIPSSAPAGWNGGGANSGGATGSWEAPQAAPAPAPSQPAGALTRAASMSAPAPAVQAMSTLPNSAVTRTGNSYTGADNISGDITVNGQAPGGGAISAQNRAAADSLARRGAADAMASMPNAPAPVQAPTIRTSANDWQSRNDLRNLEVSASSITNNGGRFDPTGGKNPAALAYRAALETDNALRASAPGLAQQAMREQGDTQRAGLQVTASGLNAAADRQNALERTLIGERGANARAGLSAAATLDAARLKAQMEGKAPPGYRFTGNGNMEAIPGGPADLNVRGNKPLNDVQSKALQFGTRMQAAGSVLDGLASKGVDQPGLIKRAADVVGMGGAANWTQSGEQQQVEQAQRDFINAVLRRESGAAIADSEFSNARQQYFPQVGDSPEVIAQKRKNREIATSGVLAEVPDSDRRVNEVVARADANAPPARQPASAGQPQRIESQQAFAALPSGSRFVAPDGTVRVKP